MEKLTKEEYGQRILELEKVFYYKLNIKNILNDIEIAEFFENIMKYLRHSKGKDLVGRTPETLEKNIEYFTNFGLNIGLTPKEIINCIKNFPNILNIMDDKFLYKYIFLSIIENENNMVRKTKLIKETADFEVSLETIYARYCLMKELKYNKISWSNLVHESHLEFINKFVKGAYYKPYKIFNSPDDMTSEMLKNKYPINYDFIKALMNNSNGGLNVIRTK